MRTFLVNGARHAYGHTSGEPTRPLVWARCGRRAVGALVIDTARGVDCAQCEAIVTREGGR